MVARLFRLRLTLLLNAFRGPISRVARTLALGALALVGAWALAAVPGWFIESTDERTSVDTVISALVLGIAVVAPLFVNRGHLEPRQFGQVPVPPARLATALLVSTVLSWPVLWLLSWAAILVALRTDWHTNWWASLCGVALSVLFAIGGARVVSAAAKLLVSSRNASALRSIGLLVVVAALPVLVFVVAQALRSPNSTMAADAANVLGWTPIGAPVAGIALAAEGDAAGALMRFAVVAVAVLLLGALWYPLVRFSVQHIARPIDPGVARQGLGWFERFPARPASVIGARALTYWVRDPRYRVSLAAIPFAPIAMLGALWVAGVDVSVLALVPLPVVLLLLGWSLHNDVAMDSTAVWIHVASGTRGRDDRWGRLAPVLLIGLPLLLVGASLTVTVVGDWRVLPAVIGLNLGVFLAACGVASVFSVWMPYPATRPGDSPFAQPSVSGSGSGFAQSLSMISALVLALPPVLVAASAISDLSFGMNLAALGFGLAYGAIVLAVGVLLGGRIFDRAAPELLSVTQMFD